MWRSAPALFFAMCAAALLAVLAARTTPAPPRITYGIRDSRALYITESDCSFFGLCRLPTRELLANLEVPPVGQWSPDGAFLAARLDDAWRVFPADCLLAGSSRCEGIPLPAIIGAPRIAWGPDGSLIATVIPGDDALTLYSRGCWETGDSPCRNFRIPLDRQHQAAHLDWSPDGAYIAWVDLGFSGLTVLHTACFDAPPCTPRPLPLPRGTARPSWPSFAPDSRTLLFTADSSGIGIGHQLHVADVETGVIQALTRGPLEHVYGRWSPDGRLIAYSAFLGVNSGDLGVFILDVERGLRGRLPFQPGADLLYADWAPG